jgi:hypothetical protein
MLHAKLYRFDEVILFGSANMTGKALGWKAPANVELLHAPKELKEELLAFERELLNSAIQVDAAYRDSIRAQVDHLLATSISIKHVFEAETHTVELFWLPICRTPERLWSVYSEPEAARRRMVQSG